MIIRKQAYNLGSEGENLERIEYCLLISTSFALVHSWRSVENKQYISVKLFEVIKKKITTMDKSFS